MDVVEFLATQVFIQAPVFLGLIALIGLVLQRRRPVDVIEGTVKTVVGILILFAGIDVFLASLLPLTDVLRTSFGVVGVLPDAFGPFGIVFRDYGQTIALAFILAFVLHLVLVRLMPVPVFRNLFLTGHIMLFQTSWFVIALAGLMNVDGAVQIVAAGIFTAVLWTFLPALARPFTRPLTNDEYTLGHLNTLAVVIPDGIGRFFKGTRKSDELELPGFLAVFNDYTVLLAVLMPVTYLIIGLLAGEAAVAQLAADQNWIIYLIMSGLKFAAGIAIVLFGVRMFLAAIIPAFEGISTRLLPGARPALDDPVFYPFAPVAAIVGFVFDFLASVVVTLILVLISAPVIVFPGPIYFFFDGALAGVFGDRVGGWKGAAVGGALMGILVTAGSVPLYFLQPTLQGTGLMFSGPDMVLLLPLFYVMKLVGDISGEASGLIALGLAGAAVIALFIVAFVVRARGRQGRTAHSPA